VEVLLEVEGELGVREQVRIPVAPAWRSPRDVDLPIDIVEPYLDAAPLAGRPALGGDINHAALFQSVLYLRIHTSSPVMLAIDMKAIQHTTFEHTASVRRVSASDIIYLTWFQNYLSPVPAVKGFVRDPCLCLIEHKQVYLAAQIMPRTMRI
jgi:hypothetical protein